MSSTRKAKPATGMAASEFLKRLFPPGSRIALASFANVRGDTRFPTRADFITDPDEVVDFLRVNDKPGRACHFGVLPVTRRKRGKDYIVASIAVYTSISTFTALSKMQDRRGGTEQAEASAVCHGGFRPRVSWLLAAR